MRSSALIAVLASASLVVSVPAAGAAAGAGGPTAAAAKKKPKKKPKPRSRSRTRAPQPQRGETNLPAAHHSASGTITITTESRSVCMIPGFSGATKTTTMTDVLEVSFSGSGTPGGSGGRSPNGTGSLTVSSRRRLVTDDQVTGNSPVRPSHSDTGWQDERPTHEDFGSLVRIEGGRLVVDLKSTTRQRLRKAVVRPADGTSVPIAFDETKPSDRVPHTNGCSNETKTTTTKGTVTVRRH